MKIVLVASMFLIVVVAASGCTSAMKSEAKTPPIRSSGHPETWQPINWHGKNIASAYARLATDNAKFQTIEVLVNVATPNHNVSGTAVRSTIQTWVLRCRTGAGAILATSTFSMPMAKGKYLSTADFSVPVGSLRPIPWVSTLCERLGIVPGWKQN